ncbi:MAG: hypothetical protein OCD02_03190 [Spirochaetaceae bacterium]
MLKKEYHKSFLQLAYNSIIVDGVIADEELNIFDNLKSEVQLNEYIPGEIPSSDVLNDLKNITLKEKKIILIELLGILLCDDIFADKEKDFLNVIAKEWNLSEALIEEAVEWVNNFNTIINYGYSLITNEKVK